MTLPYAGYTQIVGTDTGDEVMPHVTGTVIKNPTNQFDKAEFTINPMQIYPATNQWVDVFRDAPHVKLASDNYSPSYEHLHFATYLRFIPDAGPGPNIYVTLQKVDWMLNDAASGTTLDPNSTADITDDSPCIDFPHWTGIYK